MAIVSPSVLSADFSALGKEIQKVVDAGAQYVHIDVMDGAFVPNITIGPCVIAGVRNCTDAVFDVHLMINEPIRYIKEFAASGADVLTVHYEACSDPAATLRAIRTAGVKAGISIKPKTAPNVLLPLLPLCDTVLIMTVEPGFGGQKLIPETIGSIKTVKRMKEQTETNFLIEADGGITTDNVAQLVAAGVDAVVAGSAIFSSPDPAAVIRAMKECQ